ncbi:DUF2510 domain-containing protein [Demequina litorisediminis]|uniref:DUF2510 domain-containing protein n=1 Tax=Demequina litorisediminis TaxID=1849022 RepID=A0ABQ6ICS9_9MICO|nr:DUF2510 domain-containing protein [Demequina litorisediminis]GMA34903.1 hypothetical protein GCM10025876_11070 [Demequina litorisediminis]
MANAVAGWYDDGSGKERWWDGEAWTETTRDKAPEGGGVSGMIGRAQADAAAGAQPRPGAAGANYVVLQVVLKEKMWGSGSNNLTEARRRHQSAGGARLPAAHHHHVGGGSQGFGGGDRIQATMVFERLT